MRYFFLITLLACGGAPKPAPMPEPTPAPVATPVPVAPPADPPPKTEGTITEAWVHGIHVLVKRTPHAESTVTNLYLRGGVRNWTATDAGVEGIALMTAVHGGTAKWPRDVFTQRLSDLGSTLEATSNEDDSSIEAWSLTPVWDQTFEMLVSAFLHPALPPEQIEIERQRVLAQLADEQANPDALLALRSHAVVFAGSPYANRAIGTKASVTSLTGEQLRAHLAKLRDRSRLLLVVVGDVDPDRVIAATNAAFTELHPGTYHEDALPKIADRRGALTTFEQALPTNYILATTAGPAWGSSEFFPAWLGMSALYTRMFEEVRTKRNLSYAPRAYMRAISQLPWVSLYVTAVDPIATMKVMLDEANKLRDVPIPADELERAKARSSPGR